MNHELESNGYTTHHIPSVIHALVDETVDHTGTALLDAVRWSFALRAGPFADAHTRRHVRHVPRRVNV